MINKIREKIINAYKLLLKNDSHLLIVDANERSITHKLAEYLQLEFPQYNVDCEYNRKGLGIKKLDSFKKNIKSDDTDATSVYPDIIIHHRGTENNLVVIEAKKLSNLGNDDEKLLAYKKDLKYKYAFAVKFFVGDNFSIYKDRDLNEFIIKKL